VSNPDYPQEAGFIETLERAIDTEISGQFAYIATSVGLEIINISDPSKPEIAGNVEISNLTSVEIKEKVVYATRSGKKFYLIDVSDPQTPFVIGSLAETGSEDVELSGSYAFIANGFNGFKVIDVSNPANPFLVASISLLEAYDIEIFGSHAYIAGGYDDFQIFDIRNPTNPELIGYRDIGSGFLRSISISGGNLYSAIGDYLAISPIPEQVIQLQVNNSNTITATLPGPLNSGYYSIRLFKGTEMAELQGAVNFTGPSPLSKAIIIAGGGDYPGNNLWDAITRCAKQAYGALHFQGYEKQHIRYLTWDSGSSDKNGNPTNSNIEEAITEWADDANNLFIYMIGHGSPVNYQSDPNDPLSASELNNWLNTYEQSSNGKITIVYDACQSGGFISQLKSASGKQRAIVTSAGPDQNALFVDQGTLSFSYLFWSSFYNGERFYDAFVHAKKSIEFIYDYRQIPVIEGDNNGIPNQDTDKDIIRGIRIGNEIKSGVSLPMIGALLPDQTLPLEQNATTIWAGDVNDPEGITRVWAIITPPGYSGGSPDDPVTDLPVVDLSPVGNDRYESTYDGFSSEGTYNLMIFAQDNQGNISLPRTVTIKKGVTDEPDVPDNPSPSPNPSDDAGGGGGGGGCFIKTIFS